MLGKTIEARFSRGWFRPLALPVAAPVALPRSPCLPPPCDDDRALALAAVHAGRSCHALAHALAALQQARHARAPDWMAWHAPPRAGGPPHNLF